MKRFSRVLAVLVCAVVLLTLFVSSACCAHRAGHGCAGEDCRLCRLAALAGQSVPSLRSCFLSWTSFCVLHTGMTGTGEQETACPGRALPRWGGRSA